MSINKYKHTICYHLHYFFTAIKLQLSIYYIHVRVVVFILTSIFMAQLVKHLEFGFKESDRQLDTTLAYMNALPKFMSRVDRGVLKIEICLSLKTFLTRLLTPGTGIIPTFSILLFFYFDMFVFYIYILGVFDVFQSLL